MEVSIEQNPVKIIDQHEEIAHETAIKNIAGHVSKAGIQTAPQEIDPHKNSLLKEINQRVGDLGYEFNAAVHGITEGEGLHPALDRSVEGASVIDLEKERRNRMKKAA